MNKQIRWKARYNYNFLVLEQNPYFVELLGFFAGDGTICNKHVSVYVKSYEEPYVRSLLGKTNLQIHSEYIMKRIKYTPFKRWIFGGINMVDWLRNNCYSHGEKIIPKIAFDYPANFLRGFWEAEGSVQNRKNKNYTSDRLILVNTNKILMKGTAILMDLLELKYKIRWYVYGWHKPAGYLEVLRRDQEKFMKTVGFGTEIKRDKWRAPPSQRVPEASLKNLSLRWKNKRKKREDIIMGVV